MSWVISQQLNIMLFMSGVCGILAVSTLFIKSLPGRRKSILALMEVAAMAVLLFDRFSYLYRGDVSEVGFLMVRISNGLVYFMQIFIPHMVTQYLKDRYHDIDNTGRTPMRLKICELLFAAGTVLIVVSQFTGLYYTFDAQNYYLRSPGNILCYILPLLIIFLQESFIIQHRTELSTGLAKALGVSIALPTIASIVQFLNYGLSITNITMTLVVIIFYIYSLIELSRSVEKSRAYELEVLISAQKKEAAMFQQTVEALANAIDAKDNYTHGHSTRVALLSRQIAEEAGLSEEECQEVYFCALLHDIGKIGIPDGILRKTGRLTDEEFGQIKQHPILGSQILSNIKLSPNLSIGAHYHHERYDGKGYPEGLSGEDIPVTARIIAVADAYDAMTSTRSYRDSLPTQKVKSELIRGIGTQFDPGFAKIILRIIFGETEITK